MFASASVTPRSSAQSVAPTPAKPTTRVENEVGLRRVQELGEVAADLDVLDTVCGGELVERLHTGRESADLEIRMGIHDLERLPADRAGRAEQRDPLDAAVATGEG